MGAIYKAVDNNGVVELQPIVATADDQTVKELAKSMEVHSATIDGDVVYYKYGFGQAEVWGKRRAGKSTQTFPITFDSTPTLALANLNGGSGNTMHEQPRSVSTTRIEVYETQYGTLPRTPTDSWWFLVKGPYSG